MRDDVERPVHVQIHVDRRPGGNVVLEAEGLRLVLEGLSLLVPVERRRSASGPQARALDDVEILPGVVVEIREPRVPAPASEFRVPFAGDVAEPVS